MFLLTTPTGLKELSRAAATRDDMIYLALISRLGFRDVSEFRQNAQVKGRDAVLRMVTNAGGAALPEGRILISDDIDDPDAFTLAWIKNRIAAAASNLPDPYYLEALRFQAALKVDDA